MDLFTPPTISAVSCEQVYQSVKHLFGNYDYKLTNTFIYSWESDFFGMSTSHYTVEVEVKVSMSDFKRDFTHKTAKHALFNRHKEPEVFAKIPNKFFYACPAGLILPEQVPSYAGLIYVQREDILSPSYRIVKPAPFLHKVKQNLSSTLLGKYYFKNGDVKNSLNTFLHHHGHKLDRFQEEDLNRILKRLG